MARRSRGKPGGRQARATSRRKTSPTPATEAEVVQDAGGVGMEGAVAIITAIVLVVGLIFLDMELGRHYGKGFFF